MKAILIIALAGLFAAPSAFATGSAPKPAQAQKQKQAQAQKQTANATASQSVTVPLALEGPSFPSELKTVPNVSLGGLYPSANCHGTSNASVSVMGLGLGGGTSWEDTDCQLRETARSFQGLGRIADAVAVLCSSKHAAAAPSCMRPKAEAEKPVTAKPDYCADSIIASRREECK